MKALLDKAVTAIGGYARGNQRRLDPAEGGTITGTGDEEYFIPPPVMVLQDIHAPALSTLISDGGATIEGDDVLFRKNNVLLKHQSGSLFKKASRKDVLHSGGVESGDQGDSLDNHNLIPGFLFVTTRGSNFGTTLILNWAPNSSMTVPQSEHEIACSQTYSPEATSINSNPLSTVQSCSSISIDLCSMEMIRIFYRMDDSGFILSGELVVKSKEENFKVHLIPPMINCSSGYYL